MRLTLIRRGGFAGLIPPPATLDTAALPRGDAKRIEQLVASAAFFNLPRSLEAPGQQPDRFQFTLSIADDNGQEHTVTCDEQAASETFLELVRAVQNATGK